MCVNCIKTGRISPSARSEKVRGAYVSVKAHVSLQLTVIGLWTCISDSRGCTCWIFPVETGSGVNGDRRTDGIRFEKGVPKRFRLTQVAKCGPRHIEPQHPAAHTDFLSYDNVGVWCRST